MIDKSKQYRTRAGHEVEVFKTDAGGRWPIIAAYKDKDGMWWPTVYRVDGRINEGWRFDDPRDLIEVKPRIKREVWVNVYDDNVRACRVYSSKERADYHALSYRIACVKVVIDCEEGEGL